MSARFRGRDGAIGRDHRGAGGVALDPWLHTAEARRLRSEALAEGARRIGANMRRLGAAAINRGVQHSGELLRRSLLERHARRHLARPSLLERFTRWRRRRSAMAGLEALDDRLLADIGLRRGDIELAVEGRLAPPADGFGQPPPQERPTEERRHELPKAA